LLFTQINHIIIIKEHKEFKKKAVSFCTATGLGVKSVPTTMLNFLTKWLVNHILESDMEYKDFMESKSHSLTP
jgi:hemerythrin